MKGDMRKYSHVIVKTLLDGRRIEVIERMFNSIVVIGRGDMFYDNQY